MQPSTIELPASQNILQFTTDFIFEKFKNQLPDLSNLYVLLPHSQVSRQFQETLCRTLAADSSAIIPPWAGTLKNWALQFSINENPDYALIGEHTRQLLFIEALQQYPDLFKEENQWQVTQALLSFFDDLSLNQKNLFSSAEKWQQQLQQAYGLESENQHQLNESKLVYTLWHAWQKQLSENQLYDETGDYLSRLKNAPGAIKNNSYFICLGLSRYSVSEQDFIHNLVYNNQCQVIDFASTLADDVTDSAENHHVFSCFINEAFKQSDVSIKQRALSYAEKHPHAFSDRPPFTVYLANNEEQQIRAIDYFVRLKISEGKNNIAIISEDRKLSRRLRALLERANVPLQDKAGWSLATTQAATIIERWLECIEEDFNAYPLLDCLKSPFLNLLQSTDSETNFRKNIYRFEHDLIFHENVSSNIAEYKKQLKNRLKRLTHWPKKSYDELVDMLDKLEQTSSPLSKLYSDKKYATTSKHKKILLSDFFESLISSLGNLGVLQNYQNDEAGLVLLQTFETLKQSLKHSNPALSWHDCRVWLGMALESQNFTPSTNKTSIQLMTLEQASYLSYDCIVFAAAEPQHYPGSAKSSPFFNQAVRASLELDTWKQQRKQRHETFSQCLLSADEILLTACNQDKGEEKPVSPWLELLINFYQLACSDKAKHSSIYNIQLQQLVDSQLEVFNSDDSELPGPGKPPSVAMAEDLIPERISASAYQRIINCPYQYYGADGLQLTALEELSDELKKSDYGERIHLILQSFHNGHKKHGTAFSTAITENNRSQAEDYLAELSDRVFLSDLDNNVLHRSWLHRWKKHIPAYINWQIQHQQEWDLYLCEELMEVSLNDETNNVLNIYGRLDRIDISKENNSHAIIDYKTGRTARQEDVDMGENVQLGLYALLDSQADEVSYLSVDSSYQKVESKSFLAGENLKLNREQNKQRLFEIFRQLKNAVVLPAWGDETVCRYCNFSGICRKAEWRE